MLSTFVESASHTSARHVMAKFQHNQAREGLGNLKET